MKSYGTEVGPNPVPGGLHEKRDTYTQGQGGKRASCADQGHAAVTEGHQGLLTTT